MRDQRAAIAAGYEFGAECVELGSVVGADGMADPRFRVRIPLAMMNRHGLVAGATGGGKTKTLQAMTDQLSAAGVPVFLADVKGDLTGVMAPGVESSTVTARAAQTGQAWAARGNPAEVYSLGGRGVGVPIRATVESFGPVLMGKVLGLNATQESVLGLVFHWAHNNDKPLVCLSDLRDCLVHLTSDAGKGELRRLGGMSPASVGVILRSLVGFEDQGGTDFFGEPCFEVADLLRVQDAAGVVSCLELPAVQDEPALFAAFLMWLLTRLFRELPEVGDVDRPRLVFFFDEAHLLFADATPALMDVVVRTVKLIRSKGVGVFFVSQSPADVPARVLAQLGSRVQHAVRAYTPQDVRALKDAITTYPASSYDLRSLLPALGIGDAIVTVLGEVGAPTPVAHTRMVSPTSLMGPVDQGTLARVAAGSPLQGKYRLVEAPEVEPDVVVAVPTSDEDDERMIREGRQFPVSWNARYLANWRDLEVPDWHKRPRVAW